MIRQREHHREVQYRPQAMKTLHQSLFRFIRREFPRLGGPWVVNIFVDKLLELVDQYRFFQGRLTPGQVVWPAVAVDETPGYRKPISRTRQVPVVVTLVNQDDISYLRNKGKRSQLLKRCIVRAANDAYAQGGVLSCTDLGVLFQCGQWYVKFICKFFRLNGARYSYNIIQPPIFYPVPDKLQGESGRTAGSESNNHARFEKFHGAHSSFFLKQLQIFRYCWISLLCHIKPPLNVLEFLQLIEILYMFIEVYWLCLTHGIME